MKNATIESASIVLGVAVLAPIAAAIGFVAICAVAGVSFHEMPTLAMQAIKTALAVSRGA